MSILHRMTGVFLSFGTLLLVYWLIAAAGGEATYKQAQEFLSSWIGLLLLFAWSFALFYHLCNGIRHLFWDAGLGFDIKTVYTTGWLVWVATLLLTGTTWILAFLMKGGN
jgi:succinate dehydrogenase / fumarate reductase cytochrome b subunit